MSIRVRLVLSGIVVAALALVLFSVALERLVAYDAPHSQDRQLAEIADRAVASIAKADRASLAPGLPPVVGDVATSTDSFTAILDERRRVLYASARLDGAARAIPPAVFAEARRRGSAATTVTTRSGVEVRLQLRRWQRRDLGLAGVAVAGQPTRFAEKQVTNFRALLVIAGILALLVAALATWVVSRRALRPLRELAATADEIRRTGDLERRLPARRAKDVTGALAESFNGMLESLGAAQHRLEEALDAQRRFVADASHELRNPVTTIRSNAGFLLDRPRAEPADRAEALAGIAAESERIARLVDDLLTLARADAGQPLDRRRVELGDVVRDVAHGARHAARPIRLDIDGTGVAFGDPEALRRVVAILVDNALRHGAGEIELRLRSAERQLVLEASDKGRGIAATDLERVFDRFYQADPARRHEGTGLGLAIARSIVDAHGGTISAGNRAGGGAVFTVRLPRAG